MRKKIIPGTNDLATVNPNLAKEWHPTKNGDLRPEQVTSCSHRKVWWKCEKGHEWQATISNRSAGSGCPICSNKLVSQGNNDLATVNPKLASEWHPTKNGDLKPEDVTSGSERKVWWICEKGHEWQATVRSRSNGTGCPICSNKFVSQGSNDLASVNPELSKEWHPTKNGDLEPSQVTPGSERKVWWICEKGHEWQATVFSRNKGHGCPYCASKKISAGFNDLASQNPKLASEWHPTKNGDLKPEQVAVFSNRKVWWVCEKGHEWQASIANRSAGRGCPVCSVNNSCKDKVSAENAQTL